jgi:hypothetical protein
VAAALRSAWFVTRILTNLMIVRPYCFVIENLSWNESFFEKLGRIRAVHYLAFVVMLFAATGITWVFRSESLWLTHPRILAELEKTWDEFQRLRSTSNEELTQFQLNTKQRLQTLSAAAQSMSNVDDRLSLAILWSARDYLPVVIANGSERIAELENQLETQLKFARHELSQQSRSASSVDGWTIAILIADACVLLFMAWLFRNAIWLKWTMRVS